METAVVIHLAQQFQQADLEITALRCLVDLVAQIIHRLGVLAVGYIDVGALHGVHVLVFQVFLGHFAMVLGILAMILGGHHRSGVKTTVVIIGTAVLIGVLVAALTAAYRQQDEQQQHRQGGTDVEQILHDQIDDTPTGVTGGGGGLRPGRRIHRVVVTGVRLSVGLSLLRCRCLLASRRLAGGVFGALTGATVGTLAIRANGAIAYAAVRFHRHRRGRLLQ